MPDARRVAPISGSVFYQIDRLKSGFEAMERTVVSPPLEVAFPVKLTGSKVDLKLWKELLYRPH